MKMESIVCELKKFAEQYKNCSDLESKLITNYNKMVNNYTPILLIMASGFLYNTPLKQSIDLIESHPHLIPFKTPILNILDGTKTNNQHIEIARTIVFNSI